MHVYISCLFRDQLGGQCSKVNGSKKAFPELTVILILLLTFIVWTFNSVFVLQVLNFFATPL